MIGKHVLVTGGAGSFGRSFVEYLLNLENGPSLVTVFSRDELKHYDMGNQLSQYSGKLRFLIGDIRDPIRVDEVMYGVDLVVHAAAMKHVPSGELNPFECIRTNVEGARNLALAANRNGVERFVALSSDKAVSPTTLYGASKFAMERVLLQANNSGKSKFSIVRYANVFGSSGSVVPFFLRERDKGVLPVTDPGMTRFSITMREGIELVLYALGEGLGGEIVVPVAPSYTVSDIATAIAPEAQQKIIGARPGEKMHESMFSMTEAPFVLRNDKYYIVTPQTGPINLEGFCELIPGGRPLKEYFEYCSSENNDWLSVLDIRNLVKSELGVEC